MNKRENGKTLKTINRDKPKVTQLVELADKDFKTGTVVHSIIFSSMMGHMYTGD